MSTNKTLYQPKGYPICIEEMLDKYRTPNANEMKNEYLVELEGESKTIPIGAPRVKVDIHSENHRLDNQGLPLLTFEKMDLAFLMGI
ncbi:MAG: hypothetical protein Q7U53_09535 [Anaerolineaceae bacterium]|nr:hypothetical protein [Anaerolineaceae bacterium]